MSQQNKTTLQSAINTLLADNTSGDISAADVRDNLINMTDSLLFNTGSAQSLTGSLTVTEGITGSLQGTATTASFVVTAQTASYVATAQTASYVAGGNVNGAVASATDAVNSALIYTSKTDTNGEFKVLFTDNLNLDDNSDVYKENGSTFTYNPGLNRLSLSRILADNITGSLQGTASFATVAQTSSYVSPLIQDIQLTGSLNVSSSIILNGILNHGFSTIATGDYSQASGFYSEAVGPYSRAHGVFAIANSDYSCAEGQYTFANGFGSHAEGEATRTSGNFSHAEGNNTTSSGNYSHAEGQSTQATNLASHAEGIGSLASNYGSHAEGQNTIASGLYSHAEGGTTTAIGGWSHAEGTNTISLGYASHAEGESTIASGSNQHVGGKYNTHGDDTSLLIIGNGTSNIARKDAFKVRQSGSIVLPTTQSAAPSWTGTDGEIVPATVGGGYFLYMWMNGAWRSGSFV